VKSGNVRKDCLKEVLQSAIEEALKGGCKGGELIRVQQSENLIKVQALVQEIRNIAKQIPKQAAAGHGRHSETNRTGLNHQAEQVEIDRCERQVEDGTARGSIGLVRGKTDGYGHVAKRGCVNSAFDSGGGDPGSKQLPVHDGNVGYAGNDIQRARLGSCVDWGGE